MRRSKWLSIVWVMSLVLFAGFGTSGTPDSDDRASAPSRETTVLADDLSAVRPFISPLSNMTPAQRSGFRSLEMVSPLTGPDSPSRTRERWNIAGADLGFSFEYDDKIYMVFGDTWGRDGVEGDDWRSNTMVIVEPDPQHGYVVTDAITAGNGEAKELLPSLKQAEDEYTVLPTAAVSVDDRIYLHYVSVNDWDRHWWDYKEPVANGAGLAYSDDGGQTWTKDEDARWPGDSGFAQAAMVKDGDYVYIFGTPAGRFGPARLLRAPGDDLLDPDEYEYWNGEDWSEEAPQAAEVVPAPVGELSVRWDPYGERWVMMYLNEVTHEIVLRTAEQLEGPWSAERTVVTSEEHPTLYAPYMLPITGPEIYFTMSVFDPYQVYVMRLAL